MAKFKNIVDEISQDGKINKEQLKILLDTTDAESINYLYEEARRKADKIFGKRIYVRGLIEFSNFCKNDCLYCGIRKSNLNAKRYRLSEEEILNCCETGYKLGYRTFVLQSGEDLYFDDNRLCNLISKIKENYSDCAITLSIGEKTKESYQRYFDAGADRYLLRHETAGKIHYGKLHPKELSLENRKECLYNLREIGYQVGCGFMVESPYQTVDDIFNDFMFIKDLKPQMIGIGPFIPQHDTPFSDFKAGSCEKTLKLLALLRLTNPYALIPATTALGTISPIGREMGIKAGANVVMPNISPVEAKSKYTLYDNKICISEENLECRNCLEQRMKSIGYEIVTDRGDYKEYDIE